jgi:hypothetical protein
MVGAGLLSTAEASNAVVSGMVDMKPADPIEGLLIGQLIAAHVSQQGAGFHLIAPGGVFVIPFSRQRSENEIDLPDIPFVVIRAGSRPLKRFPDCDRNSRGSYSGVRSA